MKIKDSVLIRTDSFERNEIISRLKDHESLELSEFELQIVNKLKSNPDHSTSFKLQDENIAGKAFPLSHKKELLGIFIVYYNVSDGPLDEVALEFCIELLNSTFTLNILAEESEILSNISKSIVAA